MTNQDLEQRLRAWYRADIGDERAPDQLRADLATLLQTAADSRRPLTAGWRLPSLNRFAPLALVAVAVVALLIGISLLVSRPDVGPPHIPGPSHSATAEPRVSASPSRAAGWTATASMLREHQGFTATLLGNGTVLVAGGDTASAELYDPVSGTWTATGDTITIHYGHAATLLRDGRVLVAGGGTGSAELYDPASGTWAATGNMVNTWGAGLGFTATLLNDGRVLVAGMGNTDVNPTPPEIYDPVRGTWALTGNMVTPRYGHTATLLPNGKVLIAGGGCCGKTYLDSAELFDPTTGTWTATASMAVVRGGSASNSTAGAAQTATLLPDGKVLLVGGTGLNIGVVQASTELYDPSTVTWTSGGSLAGGRYAQIAVRLADGRVLVAGGDDSNGAALRTAEAYDFDIGAWGPTADAIEGRAGAIATLLPDGTVLVVGGYDTDGTPLTTAELYDPGTGS
jgi:hypothetical protein